jgi:hypothetical protein
VEEVDLLAPDEPVFRPIAELLEKEPDALKMSREDFEALGPKGQANMARMRAAMTRSTTATATTQRQLEAERMALQAARAEWEAERAQMLKLYGDPKLLGDAPPDAGPDSRTDPDGYIRWVTAQETHARMAAFGAALSKAGSDKEASLNANKAKAAVDAEAAGVQSWFDGLAAKDLPSEFVTALEDDYIQQLQDGRKPVLDDLLVLHLHRRQMAAGEAEEAARARTAGIVMRPSGGRGAPPRTPEAPIPLKATAEELADYFRKNPETRARFMGMSADERVRLLQEQRKDLRPASTAR